MYESGNLHNGKSVSNPQKNGEREKGESIREDIITKQKKQTKP
jgi:hypothetical protein